jgi:hypothetical protein
MRTPRWRRETVHVNVVVFPNGKAIYEGDVFDTMEDAKKEARTWYPLKPGRTVAFHRVPAPSNCPFCTDELAIEVDYIIYQHQRKIKRWHRMIWAAMEYYGDYLGQIAEQDYADQGGSMGMCEGRFELTDDDIECAMFDSLYLKHGEDFIDEHHDIVAHWKANQHI